jgi:hypothetical protein
MWPYWVMFAVPATVALLAPQPFPGAGAAERPAPLDATWMVVVAVLTLLIGYRVEVGGDWLPYLETFERAAGVPIADVLSAGDPGYQLLNWISAELELGVFAVNLVGGALFSVGLTVFCRTLPRPWLGLAVAVPYLVIVVGMGYSRQGMALGLALLGIVALGREQTLRFVAWVVAAATFHKSAVLLLPISALTAARNRYWTAAWVTVASLVGYELFVEESLAMLYQNYVEAQYESQGALVRLLMNALPATILLLFRARFQLAERDRRLWLWFAGISLGLLGLLLGTDASTAVDRIALYMLPLQVVVFAHLPEAFGRGGGRGAIVAVVVLYYALVLFVWLNFATHAFAWLPYRFYPVEAWL